MSGVSHARVLRRRAAELRYEANALIAGAVALEREAWGPDPIRGIAGKDETATLTAALHRDERVCQLGNGRWSALDDEAARS